MTTTVKLLLINISSLVLIVVVSSFPQQAVRLILGVPFLMLFPGYALLVALAPRRKSGGIQTFALSMALSLAVSPVIGLVLNLTTSGITLASTLYSIAAFSLVASGIGYVRVRRYGVLRQPVAEASPKISVFSGHPRDLALSGLMLASVAFGLFSVTHFAGSPKPGERFTSFYIVQDAGTSDRGARLLAGNQFIAKVVVNNHEGTSRSYRIKLQVNGQDRGQIGPKTVEDNQQWTGELSFVLTPGTAQQVQLLLFNGDSTTPYLKPLEFSIDVAGG